jgi:hypothetical protein
MPKQQINIKLPPELIEALKSKAFGLGMTLTDLIQGYCEQGLGLPLGSSQFDFDELYERILVELDKRIPSQMDERIASQVVGLHKRIETLEQGLDEALGETVA